MAMLRMAKGFYDNLKFHAKKPGSVVLGGCPTTRTMGPAQVLAAAQGAIRGMHPGTGDARYTIIDAPATRVLVNRENWKMCFFVHLSRHRDGARDRARGAVRA